MKRLKLLLPLILMFAFIAGCSDDSVEDTIIDVQDYSQEATGKIIKIDNGQLEFTMDADTTHFSVLNKANGQTWYSNPQNLEAETLASGSNRDILSSTLFVEYSDSKGQKFSYDNFAYSIKDKRYSIEETKDESGNVNGVKVVYTVGDVQKTYIVPTAITEERMEEFCDKRKVRICFLNLCNRLNNI